MDHIIERVARHADIDTRRAMGFPPRRLVVPVLNLKFPQVFDRQFNFYGVELSHYPDVDVGFCTGEYESYAVMWGINQKWYESRFHPDGSVTVRVRRKCREVSIDDDGTRRSNVFFDNEYFEHCYHC